MDSRLSHPTESHNQTSHRTQLCHPGNSSSSSSHNNDNSWNSMHHFSLSQANNNNNNDSNNNNVMYTFQICTSDKSTISCQRQTVMLSVYSCKCEVVSNNWLVNTANSWSLNKELTCGHWAVDKSEGGLQSLLEAEENACNYINYSTSELKLF